MPICNLLGVYAHEGRYVVHMVVALKLGYSFGYALTACDYRSIGFLCIFCRKYSPVVCGWFTKLISVFQEKSIFVQAFKFSGNV